jgi:tetratricopeptide (TPR) repeat protein
MRALVILLLLPQLAGADGLDKARRHFERGRRHYNAQRFEEALVAFEAAQKEKPLPELEYNMARCHEQLGRIPAAIEGYRRYLALAADPRSVEIARRRLAELEAQVEPPPTPLFTPEPEIPPPPPAPSPAPIAIVPDPPPSRRRYLAPSLLAGAALVSAAIATGLVATAARDYRVVRDADCGPCPAEIVDGIAARRNAGFALLGVAGAAAAADIILWVVATRSTKSAPRASFVPTLNGVAVHGSF